MPFLFECPNCHAKSEVDDKFAGQVGPCFSCGKTVQLPALETDSFAAAASLLRNRRSVDIRRLLQAAIITVGMIVLVGGLGWIVLEVVIPQISADSPQAKRMASRSNLQKIADAMKAYHDEFGCLPPAYVVDSDGKPAHSWRVLLLPYLGESRLYRRYSFSEPFDGPNNSLLMAEMPKVYASPADEGAIGFSETSYMVVTGRNTAFPGQRSRSLSEITDGVEMTILVAEVHESKVNWLEPLDLRDNRMRYEINGQSGNEISSGHAGGALVMTADGQIHFLTDDTPREVVEAFTTANGGESVSWNDVPE